MNVKNFNYLTVRTTTHIRAKIYQFLTSSLQVIGNFSVEKVQKWLFRSKVEVKCHQNIITPIVFMV